MRWRTWIAEWAARAHVAWRNRQLVSIGALAWPSWREWAWATCGLVAATGLVLHAQLAMPTGVPDFADPLFSAWRIGWIAHQLPRDPLHLFDANIFHPALRTLAYSDATIVEGLIAAPALWLGAPLIVVYNALMVASFAAAGLGMFALARAVTGSAVAGFVAAVAFAVDPFRIAEYSHLEMQFTCWMPLAVLLLFRTLAGGRVRDGIATGVLVAIQAMSSLYYGAYLGVSLVALVLGWIVARGGPSRRTWAALAGGGAFAGLVALILTSPYRANQQTVGDRGQSEIRFYSATPAHYLIASRQSAVYGYRLLDRRADGLDLFTGFTTPILAAAAFAPPVGPVVVPVVVALAASVDASFGLNGTIYSWLERIKAFHGFRVAGRFRAVVAVYLALLAGIGVARLTSPRLRAVVATLATVALVVEGMPALELRPVWTHGPGIYDGIPSGAVVADLPMTDNSDAVFTYLSTFHWHPLINGMSGFEPSWYPALTSAAATFPDGRSIDALAQQGAQYIAIHAAYYRARFAAVQAAADAQPRLRFVTATTWEEGDCRLYEIRK